MSKVVFLKGGFRSVTLFLYILKKRRQRRKKDCEKSQVIEERGVDWREGVVIREEKEEGSGEKVKEYEKGK